MTHPNQPPGPPHFDPPPPGNPVPAAPPPPQQPTAQRHGPSVAEYFRTPRPTEAGGYAVLPISLMEQMDPLWQERMVGLLDQLHHQHNAAPWPRYRVQATERRPVNECDERQLGQAGITADLPDDESGNEELIYRNTHGEVITDPAAHHIQVTIPDPIR